MTPSHIDLPKFFRKFWEKLKNFFSPLKIKKWPSRYQYSQFFKVLTRKEKIVFFTFFILFFSSFLFLVINFYFEETEIVPAAGGLFREGVVGQPRFINPIYASISDNDRDLVELLFSGLMKYNSDGKIVPDLAKGYEIKEEGKVYEVELKENLFWSNGERLTTDDIIFTIETIQNSDYKSPLRASWAGVEIEKISDFKVRFKLKNPYSSFLENLTLKPISKKIWHDIPAPNFPLTEYNLAAIGSGPYKILKREQDELGYIKSLTLVPNLYYHGKKPYIQKIIFRFFPKEEELLKAAKRKEIDGFSLSFSQDFSLGKNIFRIYRFSLPRYFAVFFNPKKSKVLEDLQVRKALNFGTDKKEILDKILPKGAEIVHSPILPEIYGFNLPLENYPFDLEKAKKILEEAEFFEDENGWRKKIIKKELAFQFRNDLSLGSQGQEVKELQRCLAQDPKIYPKEEITGFFGSKTKEAVIRFQEKYRKEILEPWGLKKGTGHVSKATRAKLNEICFEKSEEDLFLSFSLTTVNQPVLITIANLLKEQWQKLGAKITIETFDISQLETKVIKPRNYDSLLFGQVLTLIPDPLPFWHSLQKNDPGLNLAFYQNKKADALLEKARQSLDEEERRKLLEEFQDILIADSPAVFLYRLDYLYFISEKIKGPKEKLIVDPSKRFSNIEDWYLKTKRRLK